MCNQADSIRYANRTPHLSSSVERNYHRSYSDGITFLLRSCLPHANVSNDTLASSRTSSATGHSISCETDLILVEYEMRLDSFVRIFSHKKINILGNE